jgi:hypothetical protein
MTRELMGTQLERKDEKAPPAMIEADLLIARELFVSQIRHRRRGSQGGKSR